MSNHKIVFLSRVAGDSTGYFVKEMRYLRYLTFKVKYSKYLMLAWQLHATTRNYTQLHARLHTKTF